MRISDWSSDVCSSDLKLVAPELVFLEIGGVFVEETVDHRLVDELALPVPHVFVAAEVGEDAVTFLDLIQRRNEGRRSPVGGRGEIGRAAGRERVSQYV